MGSGGCGEALPMSLCLLFLPPPQREFIKGWYTVVTREDIFGGEIFEHTYRLKGKKEIDVLEERRDLTEQRLKEAHRLNLFGRRQKNSFHETELPLSGWTKVAQSSTVLRLFSGFNTFQCSGRV